MKADRRIASSSLSARVVEYLLKHGHSQAKIAKMLGVSEGFVSLVKSRERGLTLDHIERLADSLSLPLGAFLLSAAKPAKGTKYPKELFKTTERLIKMCDNVHAMIMNAPAAKSR